MELADFLQTNIYDLVVGMVEENSNRMTANIVMKEDNSKLSITISYKYTEGDKDEQ